MIFLLKFTQAEEQTIMRLAGQIFSLDDGIKWRRQAMLQNTLRRIRVRQANDLESYFKLVAQDPQELVQLEIALKTKPMGFFSEVDQFESLSKLIPLRASSCAQSVRVLVVGCVTGEEAYSLGLFLENLRLLGRISQYHITACESDTQHISTAIKGIFPGGFLKEIPSFYHPLLLLGTGKTQGFFTFDKEIRSRIQWLSGDLLKTINSPEVSGELPFDVAICRHVLARFDGVIARRFVKQILSHLRQGGFFCMGAHEGFSAQEFSLIPQGGGLYLRESKLPDLPFHDKRILVIDDSRTIRLFLAQELSKRGFLVEAVDSAVDATRHIQEFHVDLVTLDLKLPGLDGSTWLKEQRELGFNAPVVIISDLDPREAEGHLGTMVDGVQDYVSKKDLMENIVQVMEKISLLTREYPAKKTVDISPAPSFEIIRQTKFKKFHPHLILIASSTGGTEALVSLLRNMNEHCPPVMVVQHITQAFAPSFFERLAKVSGLRPGIIKQDTNILPGHLYMALGDYHIGLKKSGEKLKLKISSEPLIHGVRPAADMLFRSVARLKIPSLALILTGMGKDGAGGILELHQAGCYTLAQDEKSCIVFGMPREAIERGAIHFVGNLKSLRSEIDKCLLLPLRHRQSA